MDRRELIGFILNDIKELELIVKGMYEMEKIPEVVRELAINKTQNIQDRFLRLKAKEELQPVIQQPVEKISEKPVFQPEEIKVSEKLEPQPAQVPELIVEEQDTILYQEIEPEKETVVEQEVLEPEISEPVQIEEKTEEEPKVSEPEILKSEISDTVQPEEDNTGTVFADVKAKVQERTTTNEKFKSRIHSATAATTSKRVESRFIQNLRKAINLNDRYRYQRELFGGNAELMNSVIDKLDAMSSLEEAMAYIRKEFVWDAESETVMDFYSLLESRFS